MLHHAAIASDEARFGESLLKLIDRDGSAAHGYIVSDRFGRGPEALSDLSDAVHFLCIVHGQQPGVVELASLSTALPAARPWLAAAEKGFARERMFLAELAAAAGPMPSTPAHHESETAALNQKRAVDTLARSERAGCALGTAASLVLDWLAIRSILDRAARLLDIEPPIAGLPEIEQSTAMIADVAKTQTLRRAMLFGTEQLLTQHRGLWNLLEARRAARELV